MLLKLAFYTTILLIAILGYRSYSAASGSLKIGDSAPDFELYDAKAQLHKLSDYKGQYLVLYFYPKDDTPGCTKEACHFRDDMSQLEALGAKVVGISIDTKDSHEKFAEKYKLPFTLLSDTDGKVAASYHALTDLLVTKVAKRYTFLIDPDSKIKMVYTNVDVSSHSQQIIDDLKRIQIR